MKLKLEEEVIIIGRNPRRILDIDDKSTKHILKIIDNLNLDDSYNRANEDIGKILITSKIFFASDDLLFGLVERMPGLFRFISQEKQTEKMAKEALSQDGMLLKYLADKLQTVDLIKIAVENNGNAIKFAKIQNNEIALLSIEHTDFPFNNFKEYFFNNVKNDKIVIALLSKDVSIIRKLQGYQTKAVINYEIENIKNAYLYSFIPANRITDNDMKLKYEMYKMEL